MKKRKGSASFAFVYVGGWLGILLAVLLSGVAKNPHGWEWAFVGVAIYRLVDILNFYAGLFLDRTQAHLRSVERSLMLLFGNVVEITLITAILLTAADPTSASRAWDDAFFLVTFMTLPSRSGRFTHLVEMVGLSSMLLLTAGGLGMLIGLIGERFADAAEAARSK